MSEDPETKRMQVKVLYSFNNNPTVFLSRSKQSYPVKVAQIPVDNEESEMMLGAFELKACVSQITQTSPENFHLDQEDYVVYYKDITEQPDEPFVSNGNLTEIVSGKASCLVPGRICQNLSTSYLFGDRSAGSALTLEVRLQLHVTERKDCEGAPSSGDQSIQQQQQQQQQASSRRKRPLSSAEQQQQQQQQHVQNKKTHLVGPAKATRTKSLPIYSPAFTNFTAFNSASSNIPTPMHSIKNHDRSNVPKFDKSIQDRFKSAPFLMEKVVDKPLKRKWKSQPQRAVRTRSMLNAPIFSSPINEVSSDPEDGEYMGKNDEEEEEFEEEEDDFSPYTPQQPPYSENTFQALPDLEDLDSKKIHVIPKAKLPRHHGLVCVNNNCSTKFSVSWRYFEMEFSADYFVLSTAKEFRKEDYEGMFGPLCNACYLFFRSKGFMRPPHVVRKYNQQQRYKREVKNKEEEPSLAAVASKKSNQYASSPGVPQKSKFLTPSHTPSSINQVIQNQHNKQYGGKTPNYNDLNDIMNQINNFGGPLTDIDLPADQGVTPPMIATKSNTRVINLYEGSDPIDGENKENCPPLAMNDLDFDTMIAKSFTEGSNKPSPDWINSLFPESDSKTPVDEKEAPKSANKKGTAVNMPSSPFVTQHSDDLDNEELQTFLDTGNPSSSPKIASRNDTVMTWNKVGSSTPNSEMYSEDKKSE